MTANRQSGSALVATIWTLAVLSILIASYALDAHLQTRVNLYLRERAAVDHLTDAGVVLAEVILTDYANVPPVSELEQSELEDRLEDDRWYLEKAQLKGNVTADTGDVPVDALDPDAGTVRVRIRPIESKWNINNLYAGGDPNYDKIWEAILIAARIPEDYRDGIVASWCDWRDTDSTTTDGGAETDFYADAYEDFRDHGEEINRNYLPKARNGEILELDDLKHLKGFNEFQDDPISADAILDGGVLNPQAPEKEQVVVDGIRRYFTVYGNGKINVNAADATVLSVVPGIYQDSGSSYGQEECVSNALDLASAIVLLRGSAEDALRTKDASTGSLSDETGPYKGFEDVQTRLDSGVDLGSLDYLQKEADQYLSYDPDTYFEIEITGRSQDVRHVIKAVAIVQSGRVRYVRWCENP